MLALGQRVGTLAIVSNRYPLLAIASNARHLAMTDRERPGAVIRDMPSKQTPLPAPRLLGRITLSYPDKVQRKTHFPSPEIKTRPSHFVLLCEAPEVHLKNTSMGI